MDLLTRMDGRGLRVEELSGLKEAAVGEKRRTATQPGVAFTVLLFRLLARSQIEIFPAVCVVIFCCGCVTATVAASCGINLSQHNENQVCD